MRMVGQPCRHINLKTNPAMEAADLSLKASPSGHLLKRHVQVAMYSFPLSVFGRGPIRSIPTVCQTWSVTGSGWMRAGVLRNLGWHVGICHRSWSPSIHLWWYPLVVSFLNLLHHFVPSKECSTDWVIVASFYHLHIHRHMEISSIIVEVWGLPTESILWLN